MKSWFARVMFGDGTRHHGKNRAYAVWIDQHNRNIKVLDKVNLVLQKEGYKTFRYAVPDNKNRVLTHSKALYFEFENMMKDASNFFSNLDNDEEKKEFVAGLFDAEGTATDRFVIYNSNKELLITVQNFLETIGIPSNIYRFGKVHGLQIYRKIYKEIFLKEIKAVRLVALVNKHS